MSKKKFSLDVFLHDIEKNFIVITEDEFKKNFAIFTSVFNQVREQIKSVDKYFDKYVTQIQYAGSFYDGVKVGQLNEFDMDVVVKLPISFEDGPNGIIMENEIPGFVKMKIGSAFDNLDKQPEWETHHKVTRDWRDDDKYFLQSQFRRWIHSAVSRAINNMKNKVEIDGIMYNLSYKTSGPAFTLNVQNAEQKIELDVDLVPVIQFRLPRWPEGYRRMEVKGDTNKNSWFVVPKPNKAIEDVYVQNRCWRLAFHDQEREFMKGCLNLKGTLRLMKKLRDSQQMKLASYYIKTLFLWEVEAQPNKKYWECKPSILFKTMVQRLHDALDKKQIPYFWNPGYNLLEGLKESLANLYKDKLKHLLLKIDENALEDVVKLILTDKEFDLFKNTGNYKLLAENNASNSKLQHASSSLSLMGIVKIEDNTDSKPTKPESPPVVKDSDTVIKNILDKILNSNIRIERKLEAVENEIGSMKEKILNLELQYKHHIQTSDGPVGDGLNNCILTPDVEEPTLVSF